MEYAKALVTIGDRTLVEISEGNSVFTAEVIKYAVVKGFDERKPYGSKWAYSCGYFDIWCGCTKEMAAKAAMEFMLDVKHHSISWDRMNELATQSLCEYLSAKGIEYDNMTPDEWDEVKEEFDFEDEEMTYFGFKKKETFDVWKGTVTIEVPVKVVVPNGTSCYNVEDYIIISDVEPDWNSEYAFSPEHIIDEAVDADAVDYDCFNYKRLF